MPKDSTNFPLTNLLEKGHGAAIKGEQGLLSYDDLRLVVSNVGEQLASLGIRSGDAVGIVTPNGPEAATVFIAVASFATAAPLNPSYTKDEFKFYLKDLSAKILIVREEGNINAIAAATDLGIKILAMKLQKLPGDFVLAIDGTVLKKIPAKKNLSTDISLVLHTSGTTSRPKIVPLTSDNISVSAKNIARTLKLTDKDCYLNIMPLFHIHGLIAGVLATLESGGSMFCSSGFDALRFFSLLDELKPTWFSAVPTMHQAILSRAKRNKVVIENSRLKFIRSSSASLPVVVLEELEVVFKCPVIEAYGMTEAAHQMASNPLPPLKRKPGTVGNKRLSKQPKSEPRKFYPRLV
jgi:acyl-CoA synthetase (AMP-forming)/AMP-acid ligase II